MSLPSRSIAILGASAKPDRYSNLLLRRLKAQGVRILPVNPALETIDGVRAYRRLEDLPEGVAVLTIYVNAQRSQALADSILASGIPRVIFNPGAENPDLERRLAEQGVQVEAACSLVLSSLGQL